MRLESFYVSAVEDLLSIASSFFPP